MPDCSRRDIRTTLCARLQHNVLSQRRPRRIALLTILLLGMEMGVSRPLPAVPVLAVHTIRIQGHSFQVEVANTEPERERGLMYRRSLAAGHGMLFVFASPGKVYFWMKHTLIPLDILYFDNQRRLTQILADTPPCRADPCPVYPSRSDVQYVVELQAGTAQKTGMRPGDPLILH